MSDSPSSYQWTLKRGRKLSGQDRKTSPKSDLDDNTLMAQAQLASPNLFTSAAALGTCAHAVNGVELIADAEGIAYWPETQTLLVADLHLEKGSSFARRGQLLPPYDTMTTLRRFEKCVSAWQPKRIIALGDSFHDRHASARLPLPATELLKSLMAGRMWVWVTGNHDPEPPKGLDGDVIDELREGGLILRHEPCEDDCAGELAGHLHPKAKIVRRGRAVRRSCFAVNENRMILPSFGAYTGGLNVLDQAYANLFDARDFHALMRGDGQVYKIAGRELRR